MSYFGYHLRFNFPLIVGLMGLCVWWEKGFPVWWCVGLVMVPVFLATTPWDNYAVARGVWDFPEDRIWFRIKYLPVEEYLFFILQTVEVILVMHLLIDVDAVNSLDRVYGWQDVVMGVSAIGLWGWVGWWFRGRVKLGGDYFWHLFFWFGPVFFFQWLVGWEILWPRMGWILLSSVGVGGYLALTDWVAIGKGIWFFDEKQTCGVKVGGVVPVEEVCFFVFVSILVAQSYLLFLPEVLR